MSDAPLLEIRNVTKRYGDSPVAALDDFSLTMSGAPATITTIAGESGSGKTTLANAVLGFVTPTSGEILFRGQDISRMGRRHHLEYRREVQAIFQDPYAAYNPFYQIKHTFAQVIRRFRLASSSDEARDRINEALQIVGMRGDEVLHKHPHQLSGGQRQRIMFARAHLIRPRLIVADEPVSMIDASLRAMILDIMLKMRDEYGISFLYITHDLSTAYQIGDDISILYAGRVAETGTTTTVLEKPTHPYVQLLIDSVPVADPRQRWQDEITLPTDDEMLRLGTQGCLYAARCPHLMQRCTATPPTLYPIRDDQRSACYLYDDEPNVPVVIEDPPETDGATDVLAADGATSSAP
jgi:peptide/nickel transport system ATP-binding protein